VKATVGAGNAAVAAKDANAKVQKIVGAVKAAEEFVANKAMSSSDKLSSQLDARKKAIKTLIEANETRLDVWRKAWGSLFVKYNSRLQGVDPDDKVSLLDFAKKLVELPP